MATYKLDLAAFREHVLNAPWMVEHMRARGERGKAFAVSIAPDAPPYGEGYIASFVVDAGPNGGIHSDRAYAILSNTDMPKARFLEFGTEDTPAFHTLTKSLDAMR